MSLVGYAGITIDSTRSTVSTCADNGTITIYSRTTSNPMFYSIVSGPSIHSLQTSDQFGSLAPGVYQVLVTDFGNDSTRVSVTVGGSYTPPSFTPSYINPNCRGNPSGTIVGHASSNGTPPFTWALTNLSTNITTTQSSDSFTNLLVGNYVLRQYDSCSNFSSYNITLTAPNDSFYVYGVSNSIIPCDSVLLTLAVSYANISTALPYILRVTTHNGTIVDTIYNPSAFLTTYVGGVSYGDYINFTLTNACGRTYSGLNTVAAFNIRNSYTGLSDSCGVKYYSNFYDTTAVGQVNVNPTFMPEPVTIVVKDSITGLVVDSTVTYNATSPYTQNAFTHALTSNKSYIVRVTDGCGHTYVHNYRWPPLPPASISTVVFNSSCLDSTATMYVYFQNTFFSAPTIQLLSGPASIKSTKPHFSYRDTIIYPQTFLATGNVNNYFIVLANLGPGTYHYRAFDSCGNSVLDSFIILPNQLSVQHYNFSFIKGCPGQNIIVESNDPYATAVLSNPSIGSVALNNPDTMRNLNYGTYILSLYYYPPINSHAVNHTLGCPIIKDTIYLPAYVSPHILYDAQAMCHGSSNVFFHPDSTTGLAPYKYEILSGPQTFGLQYSNHFSLTIPGNYVARVSDSCGFANTFSFTVDTSTLIHVIKVGSSCLGASSTLSCPYSQYATYVWQLPGGGTYTGDSLVINPVTGANYGVYNISELVNVNGCRDTFHTSYTFSSNNIVQISDSICQGTSMLFGGIVRTTAGTYFDTIPRNPCDSITQLTLTIKGPVHDSLSYTFCQGQSVSVGGHIYTSTGIYRDTFFAVGCDSIVITNLTIKPWATHSQTLTFCNGQSVTVGTIVHSTTGTFIDTLIGLSANGCDSVVTTNLTVKPWATHSQTLNICGGQTVTVGAIVHSTSGTFIDTLINAGANGCDSVVTTILTVKPWASHAQTLSICYGQSLTVGAVVHSTSGTFVDTLINASVNGCDSVVTTNLTIKPWTTNNQTFSVCAGQTVTVGAATHSTTGTFIDTLINAGVNGCDSVVTTHLTIKPWATYTQAISLCAGASISVGPFSHSSAGTYTDTLINAGVNGCDSIVNTTLTVKSWPAYTQTRNICSGQSVTVGIKVHNTTGTFIDTLINAGANGCDSVVTTHLTVNSSATSAQTLSICSGQTVVVGLVTHSSSGTFIDTLINGSVSGCDSIVTTNLTVRPLAAYTQTFSVCNGQTISVGSVVHSTSGTFIDTLINAAVNGCDSIVTTHLTVKLLPTLTQTYSICNGSSVTIGSVVHTTPATYIDTLINAGSNGCDSIVTTNVIVMPWPTHTQTLHICNGQTISVGAIIHSTTGTFIDTLLNAAVNGCDSIVTTDLTVNSQVTNAQTINICAGQVITVGSVVHNSTGTFVDTIHAGATNGCDSIVTTDLTVNPIALYAQSFTICSGQTVTVGSVIHSTTGTFIDTLTNGAINGCDSIVTTSLIVNPVSHFTQSFNICNGQSVTVGSVMHSTTGTFSDTLAGAGVNGCDSIVTTHLIVNPDARSTQTLNICSGQSVTVGASVHSISGTFTDTLTGGSVVGCDSIVTTNLTVNNQVTNAQTINICAGQVITVGSVVHNSTGTFVDTIHGGATNGCDSIVTTNLTVNPVALFSQAFTICGGQTVTVGSVSHSTTGTFIDTIANGTINGCDSIVTTSLTVNPVSQFAQSFNICNGQTIMVGSVIHSTTGTFSDTLSGAGANGCDSIVTTSIVVNPAASYTQTLNICSGQSVTVGASVHSTSGIFIDTLVGVSVSGCDSIVTTNLTVISPATYSQNLVICNGQSVSVGSVVHSSNGIFTDTLVNAGANGCDSIVMTDLTVSTLIVYSQSLTICNGQSISVGSFIHSTTGTFIDTLTGSSVTGCDSVVTTSLTVNPLAAYSQTLNICNGLTISVGPFIHSTSGTFIDTLVNAGANGCDSIVTTDLTVLPLITYHQVLRICSGQNVSVGAVQHNTTGTFTDTLINAGANGCDSIVTTDLTVITPVPQTIDTGGICIAFYNSQSYTSDVSLTDTIHTQQGCDSIYLTVNIHIRMSPVTTANNSGCIYSGQSYTVAGHIYTIPGAYSDTIRTIWGGCDSVIINTNLQVITPKYVRHNIDSCYTITLNGVTYSSDTIIRDTILSSCGLDSVIISDSLHFLGSSVSISASASLPISLGESTQLVVTPSGSYQNIVWSPNYEISSISAASPIVSPRRDTTYYLTAENSQHCVVSAEILVTVIGSEPSDFLIPTAFSPNGDGINDIYRPIVINMPVEFISFQIYDRWGEKVYDKDNTGVIGWDGTYKTVKQPIGVYIFYITAKVSNGTTVKESGNLTLIR